MTTDTKAVTRFDCPNLKEMRWHIDGVYILLTDHERVVGELTEAHEQNLASWLDQRQEIETLRTEFAASRAEVEGLKKDAERYRWLRNMNTDVGLVIDKVTGEIPYDEGTRTGGYHTYEYRAGEELDTAIDAAMEKGNADA